MKSLRLRDKYIFFLPQRTVTSILEEIHDGLQSALLSDFQQCVSLFINFLNGNEESIKSGYMVSLWSGKPITIHRVRGKSIGY